MTTQQLDTCMICLLDALPSDLIMPCDCVFFKAHSACFPTGHHDCQRCETRYTVTSSPDQQVTVSTEEGYYDTIDDIIDDYATDDETSDTIIQVDGNDTVDFYVMAAMRDLFRQ